MMPWDASRQRRWRRALTGTAAAMLMAGCGDSSGPRAIATVSVSPATLQIQPGETSTLTATARDADGNALTGRNLVWSSNNSAVATVSANGLVTGVSDGTATISATAGSIVGTGTVTVRSSVASIALTPSTAELILGRAPVTLTASVRSSAGRELTDRPVQWSSSAPTVATVNASGVVTAVSPGQSTISASSEGVSGSAVIVVAPDPCTVVRTITLSQPVTGALRATDCRLDDSTAVQRYGFTLTTRTKVEILMSSSEIDSYVFVLDSARRVVVQDDDGGGGRNSRILRTLPAGRYEILANVYDAGSFGAFQLSLLPAPPACVVGRALSLPSSVNATLDFNACRQNDGSLEDRYEITVNSRGVYRVDMSSRTVDAVAVLLDEAERVVAQDDDSGEGNDARIEVQLDPGRYTVLARAYPGQTGAYSISARVAVDPCGVNRLIEVGQIINGVLTQDDCAFSEGGGAPRYLQRYGLILNQQTTVQVEMSSTAVDAFLIVQNGLSGAVVASNDDLGPGTTNARVVATLPAGAYIVNVTTYEAGETGAFRLSAILPIPTNVLVQVTPGSLSLQPGQLQQLAANVSGSANTAVTWSSSDANVVSVTPQGVVRGVTVGGARITATSVADPTRSGFVTVTVATVGAAPNLDIAAVYLVQAVQQLDGRVPLVADRQAVARVFVRASVSGAPQAAVRLRVVQNGAVVGTYTGMATPTLAPDESCCSANIAIPATVVKPGMGLVAEVDPDNLLGEGNENDNLYPQNGQPLQLTVVNMPPFNIRMIPVQQARNGPLAQATTSLFNTLRVVWPLSAINATVRTPLMIDYTVATQGFDDWARLVRDIEILRQIEGGADFYYGLLRTQGTSGVLGLANGIPARTAIGVDEFSDFGAEEARTTFAHEMGHVLGLRHAPCGGAAGPDPNYPFADGRAGVWGMDTFFGNVLKPPTGTDIMTYCPNQWVSAYNYRKVFDNRLASPNGARMASTSTLIVSGAISRGVVTVDPAFSVTTVPARDVSNGRYEVEGRDANDVVLFRWGFDPYRVEDGEEGSEAFVVAVPVAPALQERVAQLVVRERNGVARSTRAARHRASELPGLMSLRRGTASASISWSASEVPAVMVRSRTTGEILAIARRGSLDLAPLGDASTLDVLVSTGVGSVPLQVDLARGALRR